MTTYEFTEHSRLCAAADAEIARLRAENATLREALKPFAKGSLGWSDEWPDSALMTKTLGDCRRAAKLLEGTP